jgi:hypothetical protein
LIFIEHGKSPESKVVAWQDRLTPCGSTWEAVAISIARWDDLIAEAGFQIVELRTCYLPGPRAMTYTYQSFPEVLPGSIDKPPDEEEYY